MNIFIEFGRTARGNNLFGYTISLVTPKEKAAIKFMKRKI